MWRSVLYMLLALMVHGGYAAAGVVIGIRFGGPGTGIGSARGGTMTARDYLRLAHRGWADMRGEGRAEGDSGWEGVKGKLAELRVLLHGAGNGNGGRDALCITPAAIIMVFNLT